MITISSMAQGSLLIHIVMVSIAGAIAYLYVYPTVVLIRENQDQAVVFKTEASKVSEVNSRLQQKLTAINNIPLENKQKLATYMPDNIDDVNFMRTMEAILFSVGIEPTSLQFGKGSNENESGGEIQVDDQNSFMSDFETGSQVSDETTLESTISISFITDDSTLYGFFDAVEKSAVPFILSDATLTPSEVGGISAELVYKVYALASTTLESAPTNNFMDAEIGMMEPVGL